MILLLSRQDDGRICRVLDSNGQRFLSINADDKNTSVSDIDVMEEFLSVQIDGQEYKMFINDI